MHKDLIEYLEVPGRYGVGAPTRQQAKSIFWDRLKHNTTMFRKGKPNESELKITLLNGSTVHVMGMEAPERVDGQPWHGWHLTECADMKLKKVYGEHIRPALSDTNGWLRLDSVPSGRGPFYDHALYACDGVIPDTKPLIGAYAESRIDPEWCYFHWFSSDVLSASEIAAAKRQLDERTFKQEYEGSFESYEGQLYYTYNPVQHKRLQTIKTEEPLYLITDFNKAPMVWEVAQLRGDKAHYVNEPSIPHNAKTEALIKIFIDRFRSHKNRSLYLTGDASGDWEDHRSYSTDYSIIKAVLKEAGWRVVDKVPKKNPNVNNRVNIGCSLMQQNRVEIDPGCTYLLGDLERDESDGKGAKEKKADPQRTHGSDCFDAGNVLFFGHEFNRREARGISRW